MRVVPSIRPRADASFAPRRGRLSRSAGTAVALLATSGLAWAQATPPVVDSLVPSSAVVLPGGTVTITAQAHDPDCGGTCTSGCGLYVASLSTLWSAASGTLANVNLGTNSSPYTSTADWQAPATEGTYTIGVTVKSGGMLCGGTQTASASVQVQVTTLVNRAPVIDSLTASPGQLFPSQTSTLTCAASDADGDTLTYGWSTDTGSLNPSGNTAQFSNAAPGIATVTCTVTDPSGAPASATIKVSVTDALPELTISGGLAAPQRLAVDSRGEIFVVDPSAGGIAVASLFDRTLTYRLDIAGARSVAVDWADRLVVGGTFGTRIYSRAGQPLLTLDPGEALGRVSDVAVDGARQRYAVLYPDPARIVLFDAAGQKTGAFGSVGPPPDQMAEPRGIAFTPGGEVVVGDTVRGEIKVFSAAGAWVRNIGSLGGGAGKFVQLDHVSVDGNGTIYASDAFQSWVQSFNADGSVREVIGTYGSGLGRFQTPTGVAVSDVFHKLIVASHNGSSLQVFRLDGQVPPSRAAVASLSSPSLSFPAQEVGVKSAPRTVTLSNAGNAPLGLRDVRVNGSFAQASACGLFLDPGQSCSFDVTYTPSAAGLATGALALDTSAQNGLKTVALSGEGFVAPFALFSAARLSFPPQIVTTVSDAKQVTLRNGGSVPLTLADISSTSSFGVSHTCGSQLAGGASCPVSVFFAPAKVGPLTGSLTVTGNAAPGVLALAGWGVQRTLTVTPQTLDFGPRSRPTLTRMVVVTNTSRSPVDVTALELGGAAPTAFVLGSDSCTGTRLLAGASCLVRVAFAPDRGGPLSAELRIPSSALDSPNLVTLKGRTSAAPRLIFQDGFETGDTSKWTSVRPGGVALLIASTSPPQRVGLAFGRAWVGSGSAVRALEVRNQGLEPAEIAVVDLPGDQFGIVADACTGTRLEPGDTCSVVIRYQPSVAGPRSAEVAILDGAGRLRGSAALSAVAVNGEVDQ